MRVVGEYGTVWLGSVKAFTHGYTGRHLVSMYFQLGKLQELLQAWTDEPTNDGHPWVSLEFRAEKRDGEHLLYPAHWAAMALFDETPAFYVLFVNGYLLLVKELKYFGI